MTTNTATTPGTSRFIPLLRGVGYPKLEWVMSILNAFGIPNKISSTFGINGMTLLVERGRLELAWEIVNKHLCEFTIDGITIDIRVIDLPNDCEIFSVANNKEKMLSHLVELYDELSTSTKYSNIKVDEDTDEVVIDIPAEVVVPQEESNVIPIKQPTAPAEEEDDGGWGLDDEEDTDPPEDEDDDDGFEDDDEEETQQTQEEEIPQMEEGTEFQYADKLLKSSPVRFPGLKDPVVMYDVESSNVSAFGYRLTKKDPSLTTSYISFKGGKTYRYNPVPLGISQDLLGEAVKRQAGYQEASIGEAFHALIKTRSEAGDIKAQRLDDTGWTDVLPKAQRKQKLNDKHGK